MLLRIYWRERLVEVRRVRSADLRGIERDPSLTYELAADSKPGRLKAVHRLNGVWLGALVLTFGVAARVAAEIHVRAPVAGSDPTAFLARHLARKVHLVTRGGPELDFRKILRIDLIYGGTEAEVSDLAVDVFRDELDHEAGAAIVGHRLRSALLKKCGYADAVLQVEGVLAGGRFRSVQVASRGGDPWMENCVAERLQAMSFPPIRAHARWTWTVRFGADPRR
jgi:hypothetical protein